jgi:O-acetyl-ADP-ribose deacetylase (regulator of RNase III)
MLTMNRGNLLSAEVEALVNTVNCVGVMGRGVALQFKDAFPDNFKAYEAACKRGDVVPGRMFITETGGLTLPKFIINFPTKRHWRGNSRIEDIDAGLEALVAEVKRRAIRSIAIPPLGAGLGGLDWNDVRPRIVAAFADLPDVDVVLFEPLVKTDKKPVARPSQPPKMTPGRATLVELIHRYKAGLLDPFVTLLEVHKLMYFMQEAGEPLRLNYVKAPYGPYAENLTHVLRAVEGYFITGYDDGGDAPTKELELVPGAVEDASAMMRAHAPTQQRYERVSDLVAGFESPFGLELLSSVHWVVTHEGAKTADDAMRALRNWNERKQSFSERKVRLAFEVLASRGWLGAAHE